MSSQNIITKSDRMYTKVIKNFHLEKLASLYVNDKLSTFDSIKNAFDGDQMNKKKLLEILRNRIEYYEMIKLSKQKPFSRFLVFEQETDQCIGLVGFDFMNIEDRLYPTSKNSKKYDTSSKATLLSYKIHPWHCNKGYGTEIVKEMLKWFFKNFTKTQVLAHLYKENYASHKLLEKIGFDKIYEVKYLGADEMTTDLFGIVKDKIT